MRLSAAGQSITGPYRDQNEDNFYCNLEQGIFLVADGMGGQQAGERASGMAVERLPDMLQKILADTESSKPIGQRMGEAIRVVSLEIQEYGLSNADCHRMGTTVVVALAAQGKLHICGVGDSRVYHWHSGLLRQLTQDHTVSNALVQRGVITPDKARDHKFRNVLWRYLGSASIGDSFDVAEIPLEPGDRILLASDGLTGVVDEAELKRILASDAPPEELAKQLLARSQELDSRDNVTCVVLRVDAD